jgi:hypothetical protein
LSSKPVWLHILADFMQSKIRIQLPWRHQKDQQAVAFLLWEIRGFCSCFAAAVLRLPLRSPRTSSLRIHPSMDSLRSSPCGFESLLLYLHQKAAAGCCLLLLFGGDKGIRTPDLLTASQTLSQLSHTPIFLLVFQWSLFGCRIVLPATLFDLLIISKITGFVNRKKGNLRLPFHIFLKTIIYHPKVHSV